MQSNRLDLIRSLPFMSISRLAATLNCFVIFGILAMAVVAGVAIDKLRVGGPLYDEIVSAKDIVADVLPPPLFVIEAYQEVTRIAHAPEDAALRAEKLRGLRANYEARHAAWVEADVPDEIRRKLIVESDRAAQELWTEIEKGFLPAALAGDMDRLRGSFAKISVAFDAHHKIVDELVVNTRAFSQRVEQAATREAQWFVFQGDSVKTCEQSDGAISVVLKFLDRSRERGRDGLQDFAREA
jgi:methyl-accepting chemotaxis protein